MEHKPNLGNINKEKTSPYQDKIAEIAELFKNEMIAQVVIHAKENIEPLNEDEGLTSEPDFDTRMALYLLNDLNKKSIDETYTEDAQTSFIIKGGNETNLQKLTKPDYKNELKRTEQHKDGLNVFVDVGGSFMRIQKNGKETIVKLDHHGSGQAVTTSATQMMYDVLEKADLLKSKAHWVRNLVNTVNSVDNLSYLNRKNEEKEKIWNEEYFTKEWPYSVEAIAEQIPPPILIKLFKEGKIRNTAQIFTDKEINGDIGSIQFEKTREIKIKNETTGKIELKKETYTETIKGICEKNKETANETLAGLKKTIELSNKYGLDTNNTIVGKTIFHSFKPVEQTEIVEGKEEKVTKPIYVPFKTAYLGTKALGYDSFVSFNPSNHPKKIAQKFFVNSTHLNTSKFASILNKKLPGTKDARGTFIFPTKNLAILKKFREEDFIKLLIPDQKINPKTNKIEKEIPSKSEENTDTKIKEDVNSEAIPQTERQKRIAELLKNQEERNEKILALEKEVEELRKILVQIQEQETQALTLNNTDNIETEISSPETTNVENKTTQSQIEIKAEESNEKIDKENESYIKQAIEELPNADKERFKQVSFEFNNIWLNSKREEREKLLPESLVICLNALNDIKKIESNLDFDRINPEEAKKELEDIKASYAFINTNEYKSGFELVEEEIKILDEEIEKLKNKKNSKTEVKIQQSNPETKREKPESYEGWKTSYHHDIEADGKSMKIAKATPNQTPMSLYKLKEKDGQMALFLLESNSITKMLGSLSRRQLEPLFNLPEGRSDSPDIKLMKTIKPAKFRKGGEFWALDEKGEVEYVK